MFNKAVKCKTASKDMFHVSSNSVLLSCGGRFKGPHIYDISQMCHHNHNNNPKIAVVQ